MDINDVVIIGAGPSGIATAIQLKRYEIEPILLEKDEIGGLLRNANLVENYPGFPEGIPGQELVKLFRKQLENAGIKVHFEEVLELDYMNKVFFVRTDKRTIISRIVVIASGTESLRLSVPKIPEELKNRVFYEIHSMAEAINKKIAIIGGGDGAFDYALTLSQRNEVIILNKNNKARCIPALWNRCMKTENISYLDSINVEEIKDVENGLLIICNHYGNWKKEQIYVDYLVISIGRRPHLDFLSINLKKKFEKLIKVKMLFMVGDVKNEVYRQTAICVGDGVKSAMEIHKKIIGENS
ncbi:MAG: NAD(P)/FAD-dependent oxidoreductase [Acidobacteriota bacterium]